MLRLQNLMVAAIAAICFTVVWLEVFATQWVVGLASLTSLYLLSCWLLVRSYRQGIAMSAFTKVVGAVSLGLLMFVILGNVVEALPAGLPRSRFPVWLSFLSFLFPSIVAAFVSIAILLVPASLLLQRHAWVAPALGFLFAFYISGTWPKPYAERDLVDAIITFQWATFAMVPTFAMKQLSSKVLEAFRVA
jgi:hypothetical protein